MFKAWMNSSSYRANILNGEYREIVISVDDWGSQNLVFTVDLGPALAADPTRTAQSGEAHPERPPYC
jgi:hypothetical protein